MMIRPTWRISSSPNPREVVAGVPMRMPDAVFGGSVSNGIAFLLTVIPISSSRCSASLPVTPSGVTSTSRRWLSVPPETTRAPRLATVSAMTCRVLDGPALVLAEGLAGGQLERHGLARDDVHQRPALDAGEDVCGRRTPRASP